MFENVDKSHTALLVIDMQNGICHEDGSFRRLGLDMTMCKDIIPQVKRLIDSAHSAEVPVIFTRYVYRSDYKDGGILVKELMPDLATEMSLAAGSWDADIVDELTPSQQDIVVDKNRCSAFYGCGLESILTTLRVETLVICGVTTNMCVETTARDASTRDYRVFVVDDAVGELDQDRHDNALKTLAYGFGWVVSTADVKELWMN